MHGQELSDRNRNRAGLGRHAEKLSLEVGVALDLRLRDQAVDRVVELAGDGDRIRALERRLDQERSCHVTDVGSAVMQCLDQFLPATGYGDRDEVQPLTREITFT